MLDMIHVTACLNTLSGGHPLRTLAEMRAEMQAVVSIPSQAGTLFGRAYYQVPGGQPVVSIPSQAGTLFGQEAGMESGEAKLLSQYPLRRAPSSDMRAEMQAVLAGFSLNTLSGGHPLRTPIWTTYNPLATCLNTLSGGHPLRTRPDPPKGEITAVSIPSQAGTLFGLGPTAAIRRLRIRLNTLSGGHPLRTSRPPPRRKARICLNTLSGGHPLRTWLWLVQREHRKKSQYPLRRAPSSDP